MEKTGKIILSIVVQLTVMTILYTFAMWLLGVLFEHTSTFGWNLIIQGMIFSVIFVPISMWLNKRYSRKKNKLTV